jgi:hypothetical protein
MAESLDRLSGGRLILGLGGGSMDEEFAAFGLGVSSPSLTPHPIWLGTYGNGPWPSPGRPTPSPSDSSASSSSASPP